MVRVTEEGKAFGRNATNFTFTSGPGLNAQKKSEPETQSRKRPYHQRNLPIISKHKGLPITGKISPPKGTSFSIYSDENATMDLSSATSATCSKTPSSIVTDSFGEVNDSMDISFDKKRHSYRAPLHDISFRSENSFLSDSGVSAMSELEADGLGLEEDEDLNIDVENMKMNTSASSVVSTTRKDLARMTVPASPEMFEDVDVEKERQTKEKVQVKVSSTATATSTLTSIKEIRAPEFLPANIARMFAPKVSTEIKLEFSIPDQVLRERKNPLYDFPEYCLDILNYWLVYEKRSRPKRSYMTKQQEISHRMRSILVDWLVEVGLEYNMHGETIFKAVSCIDRFLSKLSVVRNKLQLVGTAALFICSKFEEIQPPEVKDFVFITDETYTKEQVLQMELIMLKTLSYDLMAPTSFDFVRSFCSLVRLDSQTTSLAKYLTELAMVDGERYLHYLPSIIATAAVALARYTFQGVFWDEKITILTTHKLRDIQHCSQHLFNSFYEAPAGSQTAVYEKYKAVQYCSISQSILPAKLPWI